MILTTTVVLEGYDVQEYLGIVTGEAILGANIWKDFGAGIRDIVGGRSATYEQELEKAKTIALDELQTAATALGANAVIGVDLDFESIRGTMLMVSASGTAVRVAASGG